MSIAVDTYLLQRARRGGAYAMAHTTTQETCKCDSQYMIPSCVRWWLRSDVACIEGERARRNQRSNNDDCVEESRGI